MATLVHKKSGAEYRTSNELEIKRLTTGFGYTVKVPQFDPSEHTVKEVETYLADNPGDAARVLDAERAGQARVSILGKDAD
jgi:hypothetical protein